MLHFISALTDGLHVDTLNIIIKNICQVPWVDKIQMFVTSMYQKMIDPSTEVLCASVLVKYFMSVF
jgi:hypothetical protein